MEDNVNRLLEGFAPIVLVTGHYGCGKTNLSLNLARYYREMGREVALADLDIVNPYFRSSEYGAFVEQHGIRLIASDYAGKGTNLDIPALTGKLDAALSGTETVIVDVGGDDVGATALGRYAGVISHRPYTMLYLVNRYRYFTRDPGECVALLEQIETVSRLRATHLVNTSNLGGETTGADLPPTVAWAEGISRVTGRPLAFTAARRDIAAELGELQEILPVDIVVTAPWNTAM